MPYRRAFPANVGPSDPDEDYAPAGHVLVYEEDWTPLQYDPNGVLPVWIPWFPDTARFHGLEPQIYVDPSYKGVTASALGLDPFEVSGSPPTLKIYMRALTAPQQAQVEPNYNTSQAPLYYSGALTSPTFHKESRGYWVVRLRCTAGTGIWPGFWLTGDVTSPYEEVDVMESVGNFPGFSHTNIHLGPDIDTLTSHLAYARINYNEWSVYGAWLTDGGINMYVNGVLTNRVAHPVQLLLHMRLDLSCRYPPQHIIPPANLPAIMEVAWIRYYALLPAPTAVADTANMAATTAVVEVDVLANDTDVDFGAVVTIEGAVTGASAQVLADARTIKVTRTSSGAGSYSLTYRVTTPFGSDTATLSGTRTAYTTVPLGDYDPAHAINANLALMVGAHPSGSTVLGTELVSNNAFTLNNGNFARDWTVPGLGSTWKVFDHPGGNSATLPATVSPGAALTAIAGTFTIHVRVLVDAWVTGFIDLLIFQGAGEYEVVLERNGSADQVFFSLRANGTPVGVTYSLTPGQETSLGLVRNSSAANGCTFYRNGVTSGTITIANDVDWDEVTSVMLGGGVNWCSNGAIMQLRVWDRPLSAAEMLALHDNPTIGLSTVVV